ncbi:hypothetical protein OQA88_1872 [Cercophora sp. LCS_1]
MEEIYQQAKRTIIHLGEYNGARQAFSLMRDLVWLHQYYDSIVDNPAFEAFVGWATKKEIRDGLIGCIGDLAQMDTRWPRLGHILRDGYFSRVWIMQEVVFGSTCHIRCGGVWLDWRDFARAVALVFDDETRNANYLGRLRMSGSVSTVAHLLHLITLKDKEALSRALGTRAIRPTLCEILCSALVEGLQSSDPRDRVFGLVSLSRNARDPDFAPDYSNTHDLGDFYTRLCCKFLRRGGGRHIFRAAGIGRSRFVSDLPSWVPDWTCKSEPPAHSALQPPFSAGGRRDAPLNFPGPKEISIRGIVFDRINAVSDRQFLLGAKQLRDAPPTHRLFHACLAIFEALKLSRSLADDSGNTAQSQSPPRGYEALWKTFVADSVQTPLFARKKPTQKSYDWSSPFGMSGTSQKLLRVYQRVPVGEWDMLLPAWQRIVTFPAVRALLEAELAGGTGPDRSAEVDLLWKLVRGNRDLEKDVGVILKDGGVSLILGVCVRRFALTEGGRMALVPPLAVVGDVVCVGVGLEAPLILRKGKDMDGEVVYQLVGEAYVHGIMDGELAEEADDGGWIRLV